MISLSLKEIAERVHGSLPAGAGAVAIKGVSTDSRTLQPGDLFVPLRGDRYDGHDYLLQAVERGAVACLSEDVVAALAVPVVRVDNCLRALGDLAASLRADFSGPVVAVTGSAGKTTTKDMLGAILGQDAPGLITQGNFNNLIGLPLTLFRLRAEHRWLVLEMGTSALGEIARLCAIAQPTVGIITNVASAHLATLGNLDGVARAKGELFAALTGGTAIINADDARVAAIPVANGAKKLYYGQAPAATVRAEEVLTTADGLVFTLDLDGERAQVRLPVPGRHNVGNALAAAAAASVLGVSLERIVAGLAAFRPSPGRMESRTLSGGGLLLNDSYNANPLSMEAALIALDDLAVGGRRMAVIGDMLELGPDAAELHQLIGQKAAGHLDYLVAMGAHAADVIAGATEAGMAPEQLRLVVDHASAAAALVQWYRAGDRILLKGSRGMRLEKVAVDLLAALGPDGKGA